MAKNSKKPVRSKLIKKLDTVFSRYIRMKNADKRGYCMCITCEKTFHWKEIQAGHFMSRKHYSTRWDEDNVHPQCVACNVYRAGEQYKYSVALGAYKADELFQRSNKIVKFQTFELVAMYEYYKKVVDELEKIYI
jgi:hypothetical protein